MKKRVVAVGANGVRVGEDHPLARLTNHEVDLVIELHEKHGKTYRWLAETFDLSVRAIAAYCRRERRAATVVGYRTLHVAIK